jgi:glycosyltransferase involved in cell wall biosynthesis
MYPETANPAFGCFVQGLNEALADEGHVVSVARRADGWRGLYSYAGLLAAALELGLWGPPPDVVHGHYLGPAAAIAVLVGRLRRRPVVLTAHGSDVESGASPARRRLLRAVLAGCDGLHLVSRALERRAGELLGTLPPHRLARGIGIDPNRFSVERRDPAAAPIRPATLLMVARLSAEKGWTEMVRALAVLRRVGEDVRLQACGDGDRAWLERELATQGVAEHVELLGMRRPDELPALYAAADVVVVPSRREGFGLVGLEAMAAGAPVVSTGVGGLAEYMRADENAVLVTPGDPAALAAGIRRVLGDGELRRRLSAAGRDTAARYDVRETARLVAQLYRDVGARDSAPV